MRVEKIICEILIDGSPEGQDAITRTGEEEEGCAVAEPHQQPEMK